MAMNARPYHQIAFLVLIAFGIQALIAYSSGRAETSPESTRVQLGSGRLAGFRWVADAYRSKGRYGASRPCLHIGFEPRGGQAVEDPLEIPVESTNCGPVHPIPDLVSLVDEVDEPKMTALVMAFAPKVWSVTLYFDGRVADRTVQLLSLSKYKARRARLNRFRYGTFAFVGNSCISRFVAHSRTGRVVYDGERMKCRVRS